MIEDNNVKTAIQGFGPRPKDPYVRIVWAMRNGRGCMLSADECHQMAFDDAIERVARQHVYGPDIGEGD